MPDLVRRGGQVAEPDINCVDASEHRASLATRAGVFSQAVPTEKSVLVAAVDVAADDGYASGR